MRLPYVSDHPQFENPKHQEFYNRLVKAFGNAPLSPLHRSLLHSPDLTRGFLQFFTAIRGKSSLPEDVMELAMCRVGALNGAAFEWMHHAPLLHKAGVSAKGVETVRTAPLGKVGFGGEGDLSAKLWAILKYVDEMTKNVKVRDETFEAMRKALGYDNRQVIDLSKFTHLVAILNVVLARDSQRWMWRANSGDSECFGILG
jgi:alkylhydroperoxidase family enzyme